MGKILGEKAELRTQAKELSVLINEVLAEVNNLPIEEQKRIVAEKWPETLKRKKKLKKKNDFRLCQTPTNTSKL